MSNGAWKNPAAVTPGAKKGRSCYGRSGTHQKISKKLQRSGVMEHPQYGRAFEPYANCGFAQRGGIRDFIVAVLFRVCYTLEKQGLTNLLSGGQP